MLKVIEIENIKGIDNKSFELEILPNKPSILVAPNGFGKSSLAEAFNSMNNNRIALSEDNYHQENENNYPRIYIEYVRPDITTVNLQATHNNNTITNEFDYFVINNPIKARGIGSQYGNASAELEIKDVVLVDRIPSNISFNYSYRNSQELFGQNAKILPNLNVLLSNLKFVEWLSDNYQALQRANGSRVQDRINTVISEINSQEGTTEELLEWINENKLEELKQITYLNTLGDLINKFDIGFNSQSKNYLAAIQLIWLFNHNHNRFKDACRYSNYKLEKQKFDKTLSNFNSTWKDIRTSETGGKLVVKFPSAIHISNGERDILSFISMLFRAKRKLKKDANILIIDEVFDYLDDANLIAAQYYITMFIKEFKEAKKRIYPLILTHLNPNYFRNYIFSKQKVYYLDKSNIQINQHLIRLLRYRNHSSIKDDVSKFLLHYNPGRIDKREQFRELSLPELWGESNNFTDFLYEELEKYLNEQEYDPFAVCGALRIKIEKIAYNNLHGEEAKNAFLSTKVTRNKLEKADEFGVISPESHYLLGIIYNEGMHLKDNQDNVSPIISKLENLTIKKLIKDVFDE